MSDGRPFLTAEWRYLAMLNYEIEPEVLQPYVPVGTELDTWQDRHLVSVVGFVFLDTRLSGLPVPFHRNFEEVNLRFYVRRRAGEEWRRGVVFVKEIVPRRAIAALARRLYNEPYVAAPMRSTVGAERVVYAWRLAESWHTLEAELRGAPALPAPGSEAEFITEHYWGYNRQRDGSTLEYRVAHPPWRVWPVAEARLACDVEAVYGRPFAGALDSEPTSAFVAEGSPVAVYRGRPLAV